MAAHVYHDALPGFDSAQILHDGCPECERRGADAAVAIEHLDSVRFTKAWRRAAQRGRTGLENGSAAEAKLLDVLWVLQVQFERRGIPIGEVPTSAVTSIG